MDVLRQTLKASDRHENQEKNRVQKSNGGFVGEDRSAVSTRSLPHTSALVDHSVQNQFQPDSSDTQVSYRVVQLTDQPLTGGEGRGGAGGMASTAAFTGTQQSVIQNPFTNGGSLAPECVGGLAFLPAASVSNMAAAAPSSTAGVSVQTADPTLPHTGGQFYVMMTTPEVLQPGVPRSIAPRAHQYTVDDNGTIHHEGLNWKTDGSRTPRDERRRAQHNEVERRRRDKINNWIVTLSKIIPDCSVDSAKSGASKGRILSKACDYIQELRQHNYHLQESLKEVKRVQMENEVFRQQVEELRNENVMLRVQLQQQQQCGTRDILS